MTDDMEPASGASYASLLTGESGDGGFERLDHPKLYVHALFRLGELHLEAGERALARGYFERFWEHWGKADWDLPKVAEAERILDSLRSQRRIKQTPRAARPAAG